VLEVSFSISHWPWAAASCFSSHEVVGCPASATENAAGVRLCCSPLSIVTQRQPSTTRQWRTGLAPGLSRRRHGEGSTATTDTPPLARIAGRVTVGRVLTLDALVACMRCTKKEVGARAPARIAHPPHCRRQRLLDPADRREASKMAISPLRYCPLTCVREHGSVCLGACIRLLSPI